MIKKILYRLLGPAYTWAAYRYRQMITYIYSLTHPYRYDENRYTDTFLKHSSNIVEIGTTPVPRVIYIFWTGDNEITPNRLKGIESLKRVCGVEVRLITPHNLHEYIKPEDPLPEAFKYLSLNHKSDYLRSYFMHHYGGGYADIKTYYHSWIHAFDALDSSNSAYVIGYPELGWWGAACQDITNSALRHDMTYNWRHLIGNGAFICRPYTPMTEEWHGEAKRRLLSLTDALHQHPAVLPFGKNEDYPLKWAAMQGAIFHPLCLKYNGHLLKDKALMPSFKNYR